MAAFAIVREDEGRGAMATMERCVINEEALIDFGSVLFACLKAPEAVKFSVLSEIKAD